MTPADVLAGLLKSDPTSPRITCYDDATGERIELSGKVLANWVAKAANLLQDELDAGPGTVVSLRLPPDHWRTYYWAFAAWCVGATVVTEVGVTEVGVTAGPDGARYDIGIGASQVAGAEQQIIVTLAALARVATVDLPAGAVDEARELATYGDAFAPYLVPASTDAALDEVSYADVVETGHGAPHRRVRVEGDLRAALRAALAVWADDGSVLLLRNVQEADVERRLATEGATS